MYTLPKPQFMILTDLGQNIHDEGGYGMERKNALSLLLELKNRSRRGEFSDFERAQIYALEEVLDLAIKITESAFIPPWER